MAISPNFTAGVIFGTLPFEMHCVEYSSIGSYGNSDIQPIHKRVYIHKMPYVKVYSTSNKSE